MQLDIIIVPSSATTVEAMASYVGDIVINQGFSRSVAFCASAAWSEHYAFSVFGTFYSNNIVEMFFVTPNALYSCEYVSGSGLRFIRSVALQ